MKFFSVFLLTIFALGGCKSYIEIVPLKDATKLEIEDYPIVYYLPKTKFNIEIKVSKHSYNAGVYAEYAEEYLAMNDVILRDTSFYRMAGIEINTVAEADSDKVYLINTNKAELFDIQFADNACLLGINSKQNIVEHSHQNSGIFDFELGKPKSHPVIVSNTFFEKSTKTFKTIKTDSSFIRIPTVEKTLVRKDFREHAKEIAEKIILIRQERLALTLGEYDEFPEGKALKEIYAQEDKLEKEYLALFTGSQSSSSEKYKFQYVPTENLAQEYIFGYFSEESGFSKIKTNNSKALILKLKAMSKTRIFDDLIIHTDTIVENKAGLFYCLPETVEATILLKDESLLNAEYLVPQMGEILRLPANILRQKNFRIHLNPQTGNIINIKN